MRNEVVGKRRSLRRSYWQWRQGGSTRTPQIVAIADAPHLVFPVGNWLCQPLPITLISDTCRESKIMTMDTPEKPVCIEDRGA
jgi:hypothetical protein